MPTNPDRSCTYLVLRATPDEHYVQLKLAIKFPRGGAASGSGSDQPLEKHWPGGVKIKMTLGLRKPEGKRLRWQMVKPRLGLAGGVLFKANYQGVPITPNRVRNAKSRNITPILRKLGRQEWNKTPGIRPSLPPFT